ncbi:MAG: hypothetical protein ACNI3C_07705 [Candidatus Marinarcus sp.]|uniref:hypothetical protein n=1 Tax=Candidatus Marinarcus sp. TaxID=3100987 RepID=UPI003B00C29A
MILTPEVLTILILDLLLTLFSSIAFIIALKIVFKWDFNATTQQQYTLEKQSYLGSTIIKYTLYLKIILFFFFLFTLDKLSSVINGAMCAAGVVDATSFGIYLLLFKVLNIYLFGFWLVVHYFDVKHPNLPFTQHKFTFFILIFFLFLTEIYLEVSMFASIDIAKLVSCCGTLFSTSENSYVSSLFKINQNYFLIAFYLIFCILLLLYFMKNSFLYVIFNLLFLVAAVISLILFFSTYIYELPTHNCPFCILQKEYHYIGYVIYTSLFLGTFYGFCVGIYDMYFKEKLSSEIFFKRSIILNGFYVGLVSYFVLSYYIRFGLFL